MPTLASISTKPTIRAFAQGAAQRATQPVADFLAPTVDVPTSVGRYKIYTEKHRFRIPETRRALGGRATQLGFDVSDGTYNCTPNALDFPVDKLEQLEGQEMENVLQEGSTAVAEVAALAHEKAVIDAALASIGAGTDKTWNSSADPVDDIDQAIITVLKAAKYGSLMGVGVLFGVGAWRIFKNAAAVRGKFVTGGTKGNASGSGLAIPTLDNVGQLFVSVPDVRASYMVVDSAKEGLAESIGFVLDTSILIFARSPNPTRRDPSFMKTFRLMGQWMVPGSYVTEDGRSEVAKFDWSEDVRVTNSAAAVRLNIS
jgi:hypothetical protein